jgi:predicted Zn-dependent protease with MMP-like domain
MSGHHWQALKARAQEVVEETLRELPTEILTEARQVPVLFEPESPTDPDILGTYGHFTPDEVGEAKGPIVLYLATIEDYCAEEGGEFKAEVRLTYLHELGHHFGWDEDDLEARGLG